jgi:hypothetical protein
LAQPPGKLAASLLLIVAFAALLAWFTMPMVFRDKTPVLSDFLEALHKQTRELTPDGRQPVALPALAAGESIVMAMGPGASTLGRDTDLSKQAFSDIGRDLAVDGPDLTFLYLVNKGEIRARLQVSRCNLALTGGHAVVLTPGSRRTATIECVPASSQPRECRDDIMGLWNERCAARLGLD